LYAIPLKVRKGFSPSAASSFCSRKGAIKTCASAAVVKKAFWGRNKLPETINWSSIPHCPSCL